MPDEQSYAERRREMVLDSERVDRRMGNGASDAGDELVDRDSVRDDGVGPHTTFYEREAEGDGILKQNGERLSYNQLWHTQMEKDPQTTEDEVRNENRRVRRRKGLVGVVASAVEATPFQKERAQLWVLDIDMSETGTISEAQLATAAVSLACNLDDRWVQREDEFRDCCQGFDITSADLHTARDFLKSEYEIST